MYWEHQSANINVVSFWFLPPSTTAIKDAVKGPFGRAETRPASAWRGCSFKLKIMSSGLPVIGGDLAELALAVEARRGELTASIEAEEAAMESLTRLRERMLAEAQGGGSGAFDRDDVAMVDEEIAAHKEAAREMRKTMEAVHVRQAAHARLFKEMASMLNGRSTVLEQENDLLAQHPQLLERLAAKQLDLESMLHDRVRAAASQR
jgi:hypothetical protein